LTDRDARLALACSTAEYWGAGVMGGLKYGAWGSRAWEGSIEVAREGDMAACGAFDLTMQHSAQGGTGTGTGPPRSLTPCSF
jgi:hypothetical protein